MERITYVLNACEVIVIKKTEEVFGPKTGEIHDVSGNKLGMD
ncbi:MAG: hypothetical protein ACUVX8_12795 [Candidatus Zipacnadales bacterium]